MPTPNQPSQIGKFRSSANSAPVTQRDDSLRKTLNRDKVAKTVAPLRVEPAKNIRELQGQIGDLIAAFQIAEKRDPEPDDAAFWEAYGALLEAHADHYEHVNSVASVD